MNELLDQQITALQTIGRSLSNFKKIGKNNYTPAMIRQRMTTLKDTWATCLARHARLLQTVPEENRATLTYFRELQLELNQEVYETTLDYMATCLEELEPPVPASSSPLHSISTFEEASFSLNHLPPIRLPPFSGNLDEWENFRDRFTSLIIKNNDLTAFSRMHFLASSLSGRALDTIKSIQVTAANFEIAWKTLVSRYDNTRRLVEVHASALFNLPSVGRESALELNELRDRANRSIASLRNLNRSNDEILSDLLVYSVTQRLDHATRKAWRLKTGDDASVPTYEALDKFLETRVRALEELTPQGSSKHARTARVTSASATASSPACPLCAASHFINRCPQFLKKTPTQRMEVIKQANRCLNCLSYKHAAQACPSRYSCRTCQNRHHSMLHNDSASSSSNATSLSLTTTSDISAENKNNDHVSALCSTLPFAARKRVLLATARVNVISPANRKLAVRALLDQGSEITFISERLTQTLRLRRFSMPLEISTVGGVNIGKSRYAAQIQVAPINGSASALATTASILKSLTKYSPSQPRNHNEWTHLAHLALADPTPFSAEPIDAIIGTDLYSEMLLDKVIKGAPGQPAAQATIFGWILSGPTSHPSPPGHVISVRHCASTDTLDRDIRRFWEIEEVSRKPPLTPEEQQCEDHFANTHSRGPDGRYIVRLPFKRGPPIEIGNSRATAERLLRALHRRLSVRPELKFEYSQFLCDYESLNHMHRVTEANDSSQTVYIPHHAVIRDGSATTHLRVVFNASCQTSNATSLNDHLLAGPKLQADLSAVILRWRLFRYVYAADITKMYRQIQIDPRDIDYQRILWNPEPNNPVLTYRLSTVTYGTACAPFLALRVIRQLVADDGAAFPLAASVLSENVYVDDVLFGAESVPRLKQIRTQVCSLLRQGKFELRKWSSNSAELLDDISVEDHGIACDKTLQSDESLKILGIIWSPSTDVFQFKVSFDSAPSTTKRSILSTISKLFDPLGWSTPVTVTAKMFIQTLWQSKLDWDDVLPPDLLIQWERIQFSLSELHGLSLPRWVQHEAQTEQCELHGFADASAQAYAAVVYLRLVSKSGVVTTQLLIGKSKVAPLTPLSIPRLELQAAVLLTRLLEFVRTTLSLSTAPCYCWTDSTVVLAWVTQHPSRWKTFVANRVSEVQTRIPNASWRHVTTDDNPADCASRGIPGHSLSSHPLWWSGPPWLRHLAAEWPQPIHSTHLDTPFESKNETVSVFVACQNSWELATRYSSWPRLIRITAYIMRFVTRTRRKPDVHDSVEQYKAAIHARECQIATEFWLRYIQAQLFPHERKALLNDQPVASKSPLASLNPFLDHAKIIRVGGRLAHATIAFTAKHPIILAAHPIVQLLIHHIHIKTLHAGLQLTLATLRRDYWVLRARPITKTVIHRCVICTRERATIPMQLMGNLPKVRVNPPERAFVHCGVDYAGPVLTRSMAGRGRTSRKAYIAIFICMATRAIHLELVDGYSTAAFLGAFSRFCSRRGLPTSVYSDNGTTFVGADRELTAAFRSALRDPSFLNKTAADSISWHFIPPSAPHFGGIWEAGVRSVKHHLRRVIGSHTLTYEEFSTVLCNVEACLNSRPLAPLSDDATDYDPLTPGHFLIGSAITAAPEPSIFEVRENRLTRWQLVRQLKERFWRRWHDDYVNTLQQRGKWKRVEKAEIRVGQIVLLRNALLPPCKWELAKVTQCYFREFPGRRWFDTRRHCKNRLLRI